MKCWPVLLLLLLPPLSRTQGFFNPDSHEIKHGDDTQGRKDSESRKTVPRDRESGDEVLSPSRKEDVNFLDEEEKDSDSSANSPLGGQ